MRALGCLTLMLLSAGLIIGVLFAWENSSVLATIEPVFCQPSEEMQMRLFSSPTRPVDFLCFQSDGEVVRQLTALSYGVMAAIILLPIFGLAMVASDDNNSPTEQSLERQMEMIRQMNGQAFTISREGGMFHVEISSGGRADALSLEEKLTELKRVFDAGIISQMEYERARQMVLDDFADDD